jgi:hypothetical protein
VELAEEQRRAAARWRGRKIAMRRNEIGFDDSPRMAVDKEGR